MTSVGEYEDDFDDFDDYEGEGVAHQSSPQPPMPHEGDSMEQDIVAFIKFARFGDEVAVETALDAGIDPNVTDPQTGDTPLIVAAREGHEGIVKILVKGGGKVKVTNENGYSAVDVAHSSGHDRIVNLLRKRGAPEPISLVSRKKQNTGQQRGRKGGRSATSMGFADSASKAYNSPVVRSSSAVPSAANLIAGQAVSSTFQQRKDQDLSQIQHHAMRETVSIAVEASGRESKLRVHGRDEAGKPVPGRSLYANPRINGQKHKSVWARENQLKRPHGDKAGAKPPTTTASHDAKQEGMLPGVRPASKGQKRVSPSPTFKNTSHSAQKLPVAAAKNDIFSDDEEKDSQLKQRVSERLNSLSQLKEFVQVDSPTHQPKALSPVPKLKVNKRTRRAPKSPSTVMSSDDEGDDDQSHLLHLNNFDEKMSLTSTADIINSPRSMWALRSLGIVPQELLFQPLESFLPNAKSQKFAQLQHEHVERRRQELLAMARNERKKRIKSLKRKAKALARNLDSSDPSNADETMRSMMSAGMMTPVPTSVLVQKERDRMKKIEMIEQRRIEKALAHALEMKDANSDMQSKLHDKENERVRQQVRRVNDMIKNRVASQVESMLRKKQNSAVLERQKQDRVMKEMMRKDAAKQRMEQMEKERIQKEQEARARAQEQAVKIKEVRTRKARDEELKKAMIAEKRKYHDKLFLERQHERQAQIEEQNEIARLKQESKQYAVLRKQRMRQFHREQLKAKVEREKAKAAAIKAQQEELKEVRTIQKKQLHIDKQKLEGALKMFMKSGVWKRPKGVEVPKDSLLGGERDEELVEASLQDKNPEARLCEAGEVVKGTVLKDSIVYYKIYVKEEKPVIKIKLTSHDGDPDLYVGNGLCPFPKQKNSTWSKAGFGDDKVSIYYFDSKWSQGFVYIGVFGATDSEFSVKSVWKSVGSDQSLTEESFVAAAKPKVLSHVDVAKDLLANADDDLLEDVVDRFKSWHA